MTVKEDGFSYITGCTYIQKEDVPVDLTGSFYLLINNNIKIKLNGRSIRINPNTFQFPESRFFIPGKYQCLIETLDPYNESTYSPVSPEISMPGRSTENTYCF